MTIRFMDSEDLIPYCAIRKFSLVESPFAFSDSYEDLQYKATQDYEVEIAKRGDPLEAFTLGAFSETSYLVGTVKFRRDQRSKARHRGALHSLYVRPEYRGRGIAKQLINELVKIIGPIPGIEQLQLAAIVSHISVTEFYEKLGFEKSGGLIKNDLIINGKYVDSWYMVKYLKK